MHKHLWSLMIAAFLLLASRSALAAIPTYDALVVFGDSYCDVGNLYAATGGAEAAAAVLRRTILERADLAGPCGRLSGRAPETVPS